MTIVEQTALPARYTNEEELANSITHGVGVVLAIAGLAVLTSFASVYGTVWHIVSCSIYGASQILLYTASTLYHSVQTARLKERLRLFDHAAIFLLIAGTYTPFTLVSLRGVWGWSILAAVWLIAIIGITLQGVLIRQKKWLNVALYIAMGWLAIIGIKPLMESVAPGGIVLLFLGGLSYTLGSGFYIWHSLRYHHAVWHLFVLAGSAFHFFAILLYVIPVVS